MSDMDRTPKDKTGTPPELRFLKALVTVLAGTMIVGLITLIALLVTRLPGTAPPAPVLPARITLPDGERARAATFGNGWIAVVTENDEILILDARTGELRQRIRIDLTDR